MPVLRFKHHDGHTRVADDVLPGGLAGRRIGFCAWNRIPRERFTSTFSESTWTLLAPSHVEETHHLLKGYVASLRYGRRCSIRISTSAKALELGILTP